MAGDPAPKTGATDKTSAGPGGRSDGGAGLGVAMYAVVLIGAVVAYVGYTYMQAKESK